MVMSRNQIEDWRQKAQQKRKQKASQRQVKRSKRISKDGPKKVDDNGLPKSEDVPHVSSVNVSENDFTTTDFIFFDKSSAEDTNCC